MGCGASTANLPERGESPSPLKNKPDAALATTDFTDVDANDDGAITVAELASALEQHGEEPTAALERAQSLLAEFDADGNGVLSEEEYAVLHACVAHSSRLADITDTDCLGAPEVSACRLLLLPLPLAAAAAARRHRRRYRHRRRRPRLPLSRARRTWRSATRSS